MASSVCLWLMETAWTPSVPGPSLQWPGKKALGLPSPPLASPLILLWCSWWTKAFPPSSEWRLTLATADPLVMTSALMPLDWPSPTTQSSSTITTRRWWWPPWASGWPTRSERGTAWELPVAPSSWLHPVKMELLLCTRSSQFHPIISPPILSLKKKNNKIGGRF